MATPAARSIRRRLSLIARIWPPRSLNGPPVPEGIAGHEPKQEARKVFGTSVEPRLQIRDGTGVSGCVLRTSQGPVHSLGHHTPGGLFGSANDPPQLDTAAKPRVFDSHDAA